MILRCGFLNCYNLFSLPNTAGRGVTDPVELERKLDGLADTLKGLFPGRTPDLVALCELGDRQMGLQLGRLVRPDYRDIWAGDPDSGHVSEMLLYDPDVLERTATAEMRYRPQNAKRPYWLAVELQFKAGTKGVFWAVVNHWKSNLRCNLLIADDRRKDIAAALAEFFRTTAHLTSDAMLMLGDFNCEPGDLPFRGLTREKDKPNRLRSCRERLQVLASRSQPAFYNPMWRLIGEADPWEAARQPGYAPSRFTGTHLGSGKTGWKMWDQVMLTKRLLKGGPAVLLEQQIALGSPIEYQSGSFSSDHYAVGVAFEY